MLYAGIVKKKWAINSAFMVFYAFACTLVVWVLWAYKMGFGEQWGALPLVGRPGPVVTIEYELQQAILPAANLAPNFPLSTMIYFQFVFAAITVVILAGALLGRMSFVAWMIFVPFWITFSYTVGAFSLFGGGFLFQRGVLDYSGGYVIHLSSGTAGFVAAYWVGPRHPKDRLEFYPNNVLLTLVGAGILWIGWNGFNGGDPYSASTDAGAAVLNTNLCTAMSCLTWIILDVAFYKKPSVLGAVNGIVTGLVAITPGAGLVAGWGAIVMGFCSGSIPWFSFNVTAKKVKLFEKVDDTLGIFHTHAVAGFLGGMLTGVFATTEGCLAFGLTNPGGGIEGNWKQLYLQLYGALFIIALNIFMTSVILYPLSFVVSLRLPEEILLVGDDAIHGEEAYAFYHDGQRSILYGDYERSQGRRGDEAGVIEGHPLTGGEGPSGSSRRDSPVSDPQKRE